MYCTKCGQRLADTAKFCPSCGAPTNVAEKNSAEGNTAKENNASWQHNEAAWQSENVQTVQREASIPSGRATAAVVLGIISLVFIWIPIVPAILGLIGLVMACSAAKKGRSGRVTAGITISVLGLVFGIIFAFIWGYLFVSLMQNPEVYEEYYGLMAVSLPGMKAELVQLCASFIRMI